MKNPSWDSEEAILLVDLYYELKENNISIQKADNQILELSKLLSRRAISLGMEISHTFRNVKGIRMKLGNIQFVDTNGNLGLSGFSINDRVYVAEYQNDHNAFKKRVADVKNKYSRIEVIKPMCVLVEELKRLKKSSFDAIDNEKEFTDFKKYMHVHRQVEDDLIDTIQSAKCSNKKSLILVCGNVGDGKSHLISYVNHHHDNYLNGFVIHNDATESRSRYLTEKQELSRVLNDFSDENIDNGTNTKVIVAINLGVLSNFVDSEEGKEFTRLAKYVIDNKILIDTDINYDNVNSDQIFYHVNFSDYHIYRLIDGIVDSPYISEIIEKIFMNCQENNYYKAYSQCQYCELCESCPVKYNYEMMNNSAVKKGVINVIIETIIKDKIILSTRDLLNFFYDIMVHPMFRKNEFLKLNSQKQFKTFIEYSMPSIMYEHDDISPFMTHVKQYDFLTQRSEEFDEVITRFNTTEHISNIFSEYIEDNPCLHYILKNNIDQYTNKDNNSYKEVRGKLMIFFSRFCKLAIKDSKLETVNCEFKEYISDLYYAHKREKSKVKNLYGTVKDCIYLWNGSNNENNLNLNTNHEDYVISTPLELTPDLSGYVAVRPDNTFERFPTYINITYCCKNDINKKATVSIDYDLYKMLKNVEKGYIPSAKDNNYFAGFVSFINKLAAFSNYNEEVAIRHYINDEMIEYQLKCDEFGTYEFKEVQ